MSVIEKRYWDYGRDEGKRIEREAILEYIDYHPDATLQDIKDEIDARTRQDDRERLKQWNFTK